MAQDDPNDCSTALQHTRIGMVALWNKMIGMRLEFDQDTLGKCEEILEHITYCNDEIGQWKIFS